MTETPHQSPASIWKATLGQLELLVTRANFDTWLRDTVGLHHESGHFVVGAQNEFAIEWLGARMRPLITKTLARVLGHSIAVAFEVSRPDLPEAPSALLDTGTDPDVLPEMFRKSAHVPPALNPALTFDTFVVGEENRVAFESARRVLSQPGALNPLLIFGPSGLGKTHLLNAIGHAAHEDGLSVIYAPAERFGNDYVQALGKDVEQFRRRYRGCDVLLIDDVQFLEGKEKFQAEFFHAFNDLHAQGKQIIISADRAPSQLAGLMEALRSRLQWGLAADLQRPCFHTRLAILRAKALQHAGRLPDEALVAIAEHPCPSVRHLEGYLNRVIAYAPLVGGEVTRDLIDRAITPLAPAALAAFDRPPTADAIIDAVARQTGVAVADIRGRSRSRDVSYARHLAMYLLREDAHLPPTEIGRLLGHRDHSTVLSGISRIAAELGTRPETAADTAAARASLRPLAQAVG